MLQFVSVTLYRHCGARRCIEVSMSFIINPDVGDYFRETPQWTGDVVSTAAAVAADAMSLRLTGEFPHLLPQATLMRTLASGGARAILEGGDVTPFALGVTALCLLPPARTVQFCHQGAVLATAKVRPQEVLDPLRPISCSIGDVFGIIVPTIAHAQATLLGPWSDEFPSDHPLLSALPMHEGFWILVDDEGAVMADPILVAAARNASQLPDSRSQLSGPQLIYPPLRGVSCADGLALVTAADGILDWISADDAAYYRAQGIDPVRYTRDGQRRGVSA